MPLINALALALTLLVNGLASGLPLNGQTTGQISDRFDVYFVPAGYVFSIWGLIYAALIAFVVYQFLPAHRDSPAAGRIGWLFAASCAANIAWIFCWHYELFPLALVTMLFMLGCLISIYLRLDIGGDDAPRPDRWFVHAPFSLYLGWITVATIANTTQLLDYLAWGRWGLAAETWMVVMLAVAVALAAVVAWRRRDVVYLLVLVWALAGIGVKQEAVALIATGAWVAAGAIALLALASLVRPLRRSAA